MQKIVSEFIEKYNLETDANTRFIDLTSEIGELGKEIIKITNYGSKELVVNEEIVLELGDCLFSLLALGNELNIDCEKALSKVIKKYEKRYINKGSIESGN